MSDRSRLLVIGGASLDLLHFSGQTAPSAGGAGLYTGLAAHRAGAAVTMFAPRPEPMPPELAPAAERLDWQGPACRPEDLPRFEILNDGHGSARLLRSTWGSEALLSPADLPRIEADWAYCVPLPDTALQLSLLRRARALGHRTAGGTYNHLAQASRELVLRVLAETDAFFCNEAEAATLFGDLTRARTEPGRLLFVTRGARGAAVFQGQHRTDLPAVPARELDATGAGDTFCGTVLALLARGEHPVEAARWGVAAETITAVGPAALLRPGPGPAPPEDSRARLDDGRLERVAALLRALPEERALDFTGELFPAPGDPHALGWLFAATLQQFGFWRAGAERWEAPMVAALGGRSLKGSDFLWAAYLRWLRAAPEGLAPAAQARLDAAEWETRTQADDARSPLPAAALHVAQARTYGRDLQALAWTPESIVARARAGRRPLAALLAQLDHVGGYKEDPLRKKSALLALILRARPERFLEADGDEDVPPVVDYHVQRSCLRLGLVTIEDERLGRLLAERRLLAAEDESAVRRAAFRAVQALAARSGRGMAVADAFLFGMRRRCPEATEPDCAQCPADRACAHRTDLFQPVLRTAFY